ncbi:DedA family protein [Arthrobacter sp. CJ23]|uniref:DedA family protein n=1 Tax=Arthrobacter sp. CJ23 TaxID=2972479 RepID=UPI00215CA2E8|nr:VTT domain-containing protein [Arthrobacter sp. CJ23]UVJ37915.1 VTT domain-containing protein [Arthrobacter sp. CJ23]
MDSILNLPFGIALAALFAIVMIRVNATYWLGRGAAAGVERTRLAEALHRPKAAKAQALIQRWGPYAVVLSFLTIGLQTAVNLAAGAARMPVRRYLPAAIAGSVIWALLYATIGLAALEAWLAMAAASPVAAALAVAAMACLAIWLVGLRRRRRADTSAADKVV